jgi:TonB family protein
MSNEGHRVRSLFVFVILVFTLALGGASSSYAGFGLQKQPETFEQILQKGQQALQAKKYGDAQKEFKRALKLKKDSPEANLLLGVAYKSAKKRKDAIKYLREAIRYKQNYPEAHYLLALLMFETNKMDEAQQEIDAAFAQGIKVANAYVVRGDLKLLDKRYEAAVEDYEKAIQNATIRDEGLARLRELTAALKSYVEFQKHKDDPAYQRATLLNRVEPLYSEEARREGVQGTVEMAVLISEKGDVSSVLVFSRLGYGLDEEAVKAARRLKFTPASKDGKPVPYWSRVFIEFNIR